MIRPYGKCVLIQPDPPPETLELTQFGTKAVRIHLPDETKEKLAEWGTVLAVGPGSRNAKTGRREVIDLEPGDRVYFWYSAGEAFDGRDYGYEGKVLLTFNELVLLKRGSHGYERHHSRAHQHSGHDREHGVPVPAVEPSR